MGHLRLWRLPRTRKWNEVVGLLGIPESTLETIAAKSIDAAQTGLRKAASDPSLIQAFWLLSRIPLAAKEKSFHDALQGIGINVSDKPTALDVAVALGRAIDQVRTSAGGRSDIGEIARHAAYETVVSLAAATTGNLFSAGGEDAQRVFKSLGTEKNFGHLARDFFARFLNRYVSYYLSRELPNHVGPNLRFKSVREHTEFNSALDLHCRQAARIVQDFAGGWLGKTSFESGVTREDAGGFVHVALKKLRQELAQGASQG